MSSSASHTRSPQRELRPLAVLAPTAGGAPLPRARAPVSSACVPCRKAKAKCSSQRPACHRCVRQELHCVYTARPGETPSQALRRDVGILRHSILDYKELFDLLRKLPDNESKAILRRIRRGDDVSTILNQVRAGDAMRQLAVRPEARTRYEFPFLSQMPSEYIPHNPYLQAFLYNAASLFPQDQQPGSGASLAQGTEPNVSQWSSIYTKPFHAAEIIDPSLIDAQPSRWTTVCSNDALMRELLADLFRCEFSFTSAFQKDYFLQSMAAGDHDFCSPLLVNAVLAYACACSTRLADRFEYWNQDNLMYKFLAEAKRLWELEAENACITTIQAGMVFSVIHNLCGLDEVGQPYRIQAIALAHELRLFQGRISEPTERLRRGKIYTAWALYSWESLVGFSFMFCPLLQTPPADPLPDPSEDPSWYGEVWLKYPLDNSLIPSQFGVIFRTKCQLRIIMNRFCVAAYSSDENMSIDVAYDIFSQLTAWYAALPQSLRPKAIALPAQLQLHMYFHHLILSLFEPLVDVETSRNPHPRTIVAEANRMSFSLMRLYYSRHSYESMDLFIVIPLVHAGYKCTEAINDQTPGAELNGLRSTLMLVMNGLYHQRKNHYLAAALYRAIRKRMRPNEVALLRDTVRIDGEEEEDGGGPLGQAVRSHWPVSVVKKKEDMESHILARLVEDLSVT